MALKAMLAVLAFPMIGGLIFFAGCASASRPGPVKPGANPKATLLSALEAKGDARSYRLKSVASIGAKGSVEGEFVAPDNYHIFVGENSGGDRVETITVNHASYLKPPNGSWRILPRPQELQPSVLPDKLFIEALGKSGEDAVAFAGTEELNGSQMSAFLYSWAYTKAKDGNRGRVKVWVGIRDGFPYQIEIEATVQGADIREINTFSDYNTDIRITAPLD